MASTSEAALKLEIARLTGERASLFPLPLWLTFPQEPSIAINQVKHLPNRSRNLRLLSLAPGTTRTLARPPTSMSALD